MTNNIKLTQTSPQPYAKLGGLLYLVIIILGVSSEFFFRGKLIVAGDASATANNIQASPMLWRLGIVAEYIAIICTIVLAMIYYFLLRPVHKNLNILSAFFRLVAIIVQVVALLHLMDALFYLEKSEPLTTNFTTGQLSTMVNLSIKSHSYGYGISLLFLGCCFLVHGYLIRKSTFLPKALGVLIQVAGLCYMANGFILTVYPTASKLVFPIFFVPVFVAETSLSIWLLVKGVNAEKWSAMNRGDDGR